MKFVLYLNIDHTSSDTQVDALVEKYRAEILKALDPHDKLIVLPVPYGDTKLEALPESYIPFFPSTQVVGGN